MLLQLTLVPVREDRPRYAVTVSYEQSAGLLSPRLMNLIGSNANAVDYVFAVRRVREWIQDPNGRWRFVVTRVSVLPRPPGLRGDREWPRRIDQPAPEPEELRRARIRAMRAAVHVDPTKGAAEPDWDEALRLAASASSAHDAADREHAQVSEFV